MSNLNYKRPEPDELSRDYKVTRKGLVQYDMIGKSELLFYIKGVNQVLGKYLYFTVEFSDKC